VVPKLEPLRRKEHSTANFFPEAAVIVCPVGQEALEAVVVVVVVVGDTEDDFVGP
jgi:hypothetical protein